MTPVCRFCGEPAEGLYRMSHGCVCYPADRAQWLCAQHTARAEPLQGMELIGIGVEAWRAVCGEIERLRGECQRFNQELGYLRHRLHASERVAEAKSLRVSDLLDERDELLAEACAALKPLALLAVPSDGPIAHLNTGQEITLADIERAVGFVSRWKESLPGPWQSE